jgi:hypothetical protein
MGFRSFCAVSSVFLKGSCSLARVNGAFEGSVAVVVVVSYASRSRDTATHLPQSSRELQ